MGHIREAGRLLVEAKDRVPHGQWLSWLSRHCGLEESTAQLYMRIHSNWGYLEIRIGDPSLITVREARRLLREGEPDEQTVSTKLKSRLDLGDQRTEINPRKYLKQHFTEGQLEAGVFTFCLGSFVVQVDHDGALDGAVNRILKLQERHPIT